MNTTPARYRKRPVEVEAMQFTEESAAQVIAWSSATPFAAGLDWETGEPEDGYLVVETLEGPLRASLGDWIVRGTRGEFWPIKPDIFADHYEPATTSQAGPSYRAFLGESPCDDPNCPCHPKTAPTVGGAA